MQYKAANPDDYISQLPEERREAVKKLRQVILENLPKGFEETINYGMIGYVVPLSRYPEGYHCDPESPLPFLNLANQKNYIAIYHYGLYGDPDLLDWFLLQYRQLEIGKPDMGKSCLRFRNPGKIPFGLIGELCGRVSVEDWIGLYEKNTRKKQNRKKYSRK